MCFESEKCGAELRRYSVGDEKCGGVAAVVGCDWLVVNFRRRPLNSGDESLLQIYFYLNSNQRVAPVACLKLKTCVSCIFNFAGTKNLKRKSTTTNTNTPRHARARTPTKTSNLAALKWVVVPPRGPATTRKG